MSTGAGYPDFEPPRTPPEPHPVAPAAFGPGPTGPAPPSVGRRRTLAVVLVTLLAGLALVVAADRLAPRVVGDRLAATVQTALDLDQRPVVRLTGFPFLTQVASRHYRKISITARDVPVPNTGHGLEIAELDATLADVRPNLTYSSFGIGDLIPGASGKLKEIHFKYVDFENGGHIERLVLAGQQAPVAAPVAAAPTPEGEGDELQAAIDSGIKKIDDST